MLCGPEGELLDSLFDSSVVINLCILMTYGKYLHCAFISKKLSIQYSYYTHVKFIVRKKIS